MNHLTAKFLAYRQRQKTEPPPPVVKKHYEIENFVSPTEAVLERMGRLVEAIARGEELSESNLLFFKMHRRLKGAMGNYQAVHGDRRIHRMQERILTQAFRGTQPVCRG